MDTITTTADYDALARALASAGIEFHTIDPGGSCEAASVSVPTGVYTVKVADGTRYVCVRCGMVADTNDLTVIGRNCPATDFEHAHHMIGTEADGPRYEVVWFPGVGTVEPADDWTVDAAGLTAWSHAVALAQTGTLPDADTVEAAGLDPTGRTMDGPVTWREVTAALTESRDRHAGLLLSIRTEFVGHPAEEYEDDLCALIEEAADLLGRA